MWPGPTVGCARHTFRVQQRAQVSLRTRRDTPDDILHMTVNDLDNALADAAAGRPVRTPLTNPSAQRQVGQPGRALMPEDAVNLV